MKRYTDDAAVATVDFVCVKKIKIKIYICFFFLIKKTVYIVNERPVQTIQSVRHSKRTHRMWPICKDC